jgi:putative membrane protein insertion efficiency factor
MTSNPTIKQNPLVRNLAAIWRLPRMLLVGVVKLYQLGISPYFPSTCRYTPTCSQYSILALKKYGAVRGTILATWRILRCNPWGGHGHDPPRWFGEKIETQEVADES